MRLEITMSNIQGVIIEGLLVTTLAELPGATILNEQTLANILHVSPRSIRRMTDRGEIPPPISLGSRRVWSSGKLLEFLDERFDAATRDLRKLNGRNRRREV